MAQTVEYQAVEFGLQFVKSQNPDRSRDCIGFRGISVIRIDELSAFVGELVVELVFAEIAIGLRIGKDIAGRSNLPVMFVVVAIMVLGIVRRQMVSSMFTVTAVMMERRVVLRLVE